MQSYLPLTGRRKESKPPRRSEAEANNGAAHHCFSGLLAEVALFLLRLNRKNLLLSIFVVTKSFLFKPFIFPTPKSGRDIVAAI